ncbi:hypothetical protein B0T11DRAFT_273992 [Plectosphaerella cucumerina]|uniref:DUF1168-domain-containing protein n=1 Tax=Plectosphaerella cucumerina TaxID=40658 RepID=A0A8K0X4Z8_9PEZI|nr:hypothetical protein B0T11DRAFT_273992 [Plectosphaerella cucumerina]
MSGEGPESIPTSADPRSKRPTKKRALTPSSAQAAELDALFAKPDQEIRIPDSSAVAKRQMRGQAAPEIVTNVQGSSAGAGSGEFHVYKAARRREYERLRAMDDEVKTERATEDFERQRAEKAAADEERTRKNREKREKKKNRAKKGPASKPSAAAPTAGIAKRDITKTNDDDGEQPAGTDVTASRADADTEGKEAAEKATGLIIHDDDAA